MPRSEALIKAQKKYYEKIKHTEAYKMKLKETTKRNYEKYKNDDELKKRRCEYAKSYYEKNRDKILEKRRIKYKEKKSNDILINENSIVYTDS